MSNLIITWAQLSGHPPSVLLLDYGLMSLPIGVRTKSVTPITYNLTFWCAVSVGRDREEKTPMLENITYHTHHPPTPLSISTLPHCHTHSRRLKRNTPSWLHSYVRQSTGIDNTFSFCFLFPPHFSHLTTANEQSHQVPNEPVSAAGLKRAFTQPLDNGSKKSSKWQAATLPHISVFNNALYYNGLWQEHANIRSRSHADEGESSRLYRYNARYWYRMAPWGWVIEGSKRDGWGRLIANGLPVNMTLEHRACISTSKSWYIKGLKMH